MCLRQIYPDRLTSSVVRTEGEGVIKRPPYLGQDLPHDHDDLDGLKRKTSGYAMDDPLTSTIHLTRHKVHAEGDGSAQKKDGDNHHDSNTATGVHAFGAGERQRP